MHGIWFLAQFLHPVLFASHLSFRRRQELQDMVVLAEPDCVCGGSAASADMEVVRQGCSLLCSVQVFAQAKQSSTGAISP